MLETPDDVFIKLTAGKQVELTAENKCLESDRGSDSLRMNLALNGLFFFGESKFLGAGSRKLFHINGGRTRETSC